MFPTHVLEWLLGETWVEIGWRADTADSALALRAHGDALSREGGRLRLRRLSFTGGPLNIVEEWCDPPEYQPDEDAQVYSGGTA